MRMTAFFVALFCVMALPCLALAEDVAAPAIDLTPLVQTVIALLASLVTYRLIPWIKARTTEQQQANLAAVTRTFVYAAEQLFGANSGPDKLAYVTDALHTMGYNSNSQEVLAAIEAAVHQMASPVTCFFGGVCDALMPDDPPDADGEINHSGAD